MAAILVPRQALSGASRRRNTGRRPRAAAPGGPSAGSLSHNRDVLSGVPRLDSGTWPWPTLRLGGHLYDWYQPLHRPQVSRRLHPVTVWQWHWNQLPVPAAAAQCGVPVLLLWQASASGKCRTRTELWNVVVLAGFLGFGRNHALAPGSPLGPAILGHPSRPYGCSASRLLGVFPSAFCRFL